MHPVGKSEMNAAKQQAMERIESLSDDCKFGDIQYHLYVRKMVERGIADFDAGRVVSQEAERRVANGRSHMDPVRSRRSPRADGI